MKKMVLGLLMVLVMVSMVLAVVNYYSPARTQTVVRTPASVTPLPTQTTAQITYKNVFVEKPLNTTAYPEPASGHVTVNCNNPATVFNSNIKATAGFFTDKITAQANIKYVISTNFTLLQKSGATSVYLELYQVSSSAGVPDRLVEASSFMPQTYTFKATTLLPLASGSTYYARARVFAQAYSAHSSGIIEGVITKISLSPAPPAP